MAVVCKMAKTATRATVPGSCQEKSVAGRQPAVAILQTRALATTQTRANA